MKWHIYMHLYVCVHARARAYALMYMYVYVHVCMYTCVGVRVCIHGCVFWTRGIDLMIFALTRREVFRYICQAVERDDAMCFQLDYRGVGPATRRGWLYRVHEMFWVSGLSWRDDECRGKHTAANNCYGHFEGLKRHCQNNRVVTAFCVQW